ncbi:MAG TPA: methyltransferase domain-containing protein, partial [Candidatus Xenobia bacterium]
MGLPPINNGYYEELGERWYTAQDDPVALLRAEAAFRNQYLAGVLRREGCRAILDVGCGAGFLCNPLAREGFDMTGLDVSAHSLEVARRYDDTGTVRYAQGTGEAISFADETFDAVCCMDVLEHVDSPARVVSEMARVLRPGGLLAAYTINRT